MGDIDYSDHYFNLAVEHVGEYRPHDELEWLDIIGGLIEQLHMAEDALADAEYDLWMTLDQLDDAQQQLLDLEDGLK